MWFDYYPNFDWSIPSLTVVVGGWTKIISANEHQQCASGDLAGVEAPGCFDVGAGAGRGTAGETAAALGFPSCNKNVFTQCDSIPLLMKYSPDLNLSEGTWL